ncbi:hypothetical protein LAV82_23305 [Bacillus sp. ILBB4]|nr:hypothetical protein [Bacillus sp. ILBB4]
MTIINQIKSATSKEEVRTVLKDRTAEVRLVFLKNAVDSLNKEIECDIAGENIDIAIFKMGQVVLLEDEQHIVERVILAESVLAR